MRMRPIPSPSSCAAITISALFSVCRPANALLFAAPVRLVHFHHSGEAIPARSHHGAPQFMQPSPRGVVTPQAQHPLESDSAGAVLLAGDCPHRPEPNRERFARVLEDCPGRHRALVSATRTLQQHPAHRPGLPPTAPRTPKTIRPPQPDQILPASCLCRKARLKFGQISRIILHGRPYYILGSPESSRYPFSRKPAKMFRAGLYARVSTNDQQTIPLQIRALREYAVRRGWTIATAGEGGRQRCAATATAGEVAGGGAPPGDRRGAGVAVGSLGHDRWRTCWQPSRNWSTSASASSR